MTDCTAPKFRFAPLKRRIVEAAFEGGDISSDGGLLLLRELDRRLGLVDRVAAVLCDPRDPDKIKHELADLIRQRVFALCQGYEDLNDHG